jgi:hypothetical protein
MNTPTLPDWLRPVLSRVIASIVAAAIAYGVRKGIDLGLSDDEQRHISEGVLAVITGVSLSAYALAHKWISTKVNPTDAAAPAIASAATAPLGTGARERVGEHLEAVAEGVTPPPALPTDPDPAPVVRVRKARRKRPKVEPEADASAIENPPASGFAEFQPAAPDMRAYAPRPKLADHDRGVL